MNSLVSKKEHLRHWNTQRRKRSGFVHAAGFWLHHIKRLFQSLVNAKQVKMYEIE